MALVKKVITTCDTCKKEVAEGEPASFTVRRKGARKDRTLDFHNTKACIPQILRIAS